MMDCVLYNKFASKFQGLFNWRCASEYVPAMLRVLTPRQYIVQVDSLYHSR